MTLKDSPQLQELLNRPTIDEENMEFLTEIGAIVSRETGWIVIDWKVLSDLKASNSATTRRPENRRRFPTRNHTKSPAIKSGPQTQRNSYEASRVPTPTEKDIPHRMYSSETYEYMGFTATKAQQLIKIWGKLHGDAFDNFVELALDEISESDVKVDDQQDDDEWTRCLTALGVNSETISQIMEPCFSDVRRQKSCKHWVRKTMIGRFVSLMRDNKHLTTVVR